MGFVFLDPSHVLLDERKLVNVQYFRNGDTFNQNLAIALLDPCVSESIRCGFNQKTPSVLYILNSSILK